MAPSMEQNKNALSPSDAFSESHSRSRSRSRRRQETEDSQKAGRVWARTEEPDPWAPSILTLDGGGIRGYSSLLLLKELMHEVWLWEGVIEEEERNAAEQPEMTSSPTESFEFGQAREGAEHADASIRPDNEDANNHNRTSPSKAKQASKVPPEDELLPCHYFDFMYGTSTGGLIATILGRLRMTVGEALHLYREVGDDLFGKRRSHIPLMTKYHHQPLERAVRDIVATRCHEHPNCDGEDLYPWHDEHLDVSNEPVTFDVDAPRVCQSCCLTATKDDSISEAHLLRSYPFYVTSDTPNWVTPYNQGADRLPIWICTRATTAAPFYFKMMKTEVDGVEQAFMDGGIRENNPSGAAVSEFHALYEGKVDNPALLLSVGTGRPNQNRDGFTNAWPGPWGHLPFITKFFEKRAVIRNLLIKYTEGEKQHQLTKLHARGEHTWYKRLNVSDGLQNMPLDDWRKGELNGQPNVPGGATLTQMEDAVKHYLNDREFDPIIDSYAPPCTMLRQTAEKLVRQRRAREREGGVRWKVFVGRYLHKSHKGANGVVE